MNVAETFRLSVTERLEAAAEEIFLLFRRSVAQYEEEIERQRQQLAVTWAPHVKLCRIDFQQHHVCKDEEQEEQEVLSEQQLWDQGRNLEVKPEPPMMEEEQEVLSEQQLWDPERNPEVKPEPPVMEEEQEVLGERQLWDEGRNPEVKPEPPVMEEEQHEVKQEPDDVPVSKDEPVFWNPDGRVNTLSECGPTAEGYQHHPPAGPEDQVAGLKGVHLEANTGQPSQQIPNQLTRNAPDSTAQEKYYVCTVCSEAFSDEKVLANHVTIHTTKEAFKCKTCGKAFKTRSSMNHHTNVHRPRVPCSHPDCGQVFLTKAHMTRHMMNHTEEKPYHCKTCGKQFRRMDTLRTHIKIHPGERPYSCNACEKSFDTKFDLNIHMLIHT